MQAVNVVAAPERFNASLLLDRNIDQAAPARRPCTRSTAR